MNLSKPMHRSATLSGDSQTSRNKVPIQFLPSLCLLGSYQNHSIGLRHFMDTHRLQGFWCQYSLTFFTACADCSNLSLTHTYIHTDIQIDRQTYRQTQTDRQTDRQTYRQTDRRTERRIYSDMCETACTHACTDT